MSNTKLVQYSAVKVSKLIQFDTTYDSWNSNQKSPQVGDIGTLVEILKADGIPNKYVVECIDEDGQAIWMSDFLAEEIEEYSCCRSN